MTEAFSAKSSFYDLFCYWVSGFSFLGLLYFYGLAFSAKATANVLAQVSTSSWSWLALAVAGYVAGHFINAASSLLVEHTFCRKILRRKKFPFAKAYDVLNNTWAASEASKKRAKTMLELFEKVFGYPPDDECRRELRMLVYRCPNCMDVSGLNYMAYYGMNRSLFVVALFAIPPALKVFDGFGFCSLALLVIALVVLAVSLVFFWQYYRFVLKYSDFLASEILSAKMPECRN